MTKKYSAMTVLAPAVIAAGDYITILDASEADDSKNPKKTLATALCPAGTTNPASPAAGDRFFRTDLGLEIYYDGTRWLTSQLFYNNAIDGDSGRSSDGAQYEADIRYSSYVPYFTRVDIDTYVDTTNSGSHYWTVVVGGIEMADDSAFTILTFNTSADSPDAYVSHSSASLTQPTGDENDLLYIGITETGTAGDINIGCVTYYRYIIT